ncbi:MAG: response regulator [Candidatus Dojkabacteria bacterium]|nr:MAG: response regulator [Candidatus Dojkabacteria bacterium]
MADTKGYTVLIVEDEVPLLETYAEILTGQSYTVLKADNGYKGLELLEQNKDQVAVMILDLMMPGMDGLEVLRKIKADAAKYGNPPVVVLTNMTSERVIKEAFMIGANSYLIKSELEAEDLLREVKKFENGTGGAATGNPGTDAPSAPTTDTPATDNPASDAPAAE